MLSLALFTAIFIPPLKNRKSLLTLATPLVVRWRGRGRGHVSLIYMFAMRMTTQEPVSSHRLIVETVFGPKWPRGVFRERISTGRIEFRGFLG